MREEKRRKKCGKTLLSGEREGDLKKDAEMSIL
jgi:hypothetical protein